MFIIFYQKSYYCLEMFDRCSCSWCGTPRSVLQKRHFFNLFTRYGTGLCVVRFVLNDHTFQSMSIYIDSCRDCVSVRMLCRPKITILKYTDYINIPPQRRRARRQTRPLQNGCTELFATMRDIRDT